MEKNKNNRPSFGGSMGIMLGVLAVVGLYGSFVWLPSLLPDIFPPQASAEAKNVDELFKVLLILGGVVFFLIQGLLVISVIAFRKRPDDNTDGPSDHGNMTVEIVWTIIPALVVVFLSILSFNVWNDNTKPKENVNIINGESIPIHVTGARFAWTHNYDTSEVNILGEPIVLNTGSELHTYIGQNIKLVMQTQDVIHSYWVPAMRVKQDLLPGNPDKGGRPTEIQFTPILVEGETYPANYPIVCAELCGDGHGRMRGKVVVYENEEQFLELFYNPTIESVRVPPSDPVERGEGVIQEYACVGCHTLERLEWVGITGPTLNNIGASAGQRVAGQTAEEYLADSVWNSGEFMVPGYQNLMPKFGIDSTGTEQMSAENLYAIVAYLCTLPSPEESSCDTENASTVIPEAINTLFEVDVDVTFGLSEAMSSDAEATAEPEAEATEEASD
jgi:cytochrome c oxidase subunit II